MKSATRLSGRRGEPFNYVWISKQHLPERKGQRCRVLLSRGDRPRLSFDSQFEFEDGVKIVASRSSAMRV